MEKFSAEFFQKQDGTKPAKEFLLSQNTKMQAKLFGLIDILEEKGNQLKQYKKEFLESEGKQ